MCKQEKQEIKKPSMARNSTKKSRGSLSKALKEQARMAYRGAILEAAEREFSRRGFHDTKMADLAREAGVSVGTLYNHFENKEIVFVSLMKEIGEGFFEHLDGGADLEDPVEQLRQLVSRTFGFVEERDRLFLMYTQMGAFVEVQLANLGDDFENRAALLGNRIEAILRDGVEGGRIRADLEVRTMATALWGVMYATLSEWIASDRGRPLSDRADELLKLFFEGAAVEGDTRRSM